MSVDFFSCGYWDVSLHRVSPYWPMDSVNNVRTLLLTDFSIRIFPDQSFFAAPRDFSQLYTSFIACRCQGILHVLLVAWPPSNICFFVVSTLSNFQSCLACLVFRLFSVFLPLYFSMNFRLPPDIVKLFSFYFLYGGRTWSWTKDLVLIRDAL